MWTHQIVGCASLATNSTDDVVMNPPNDDSLSEQMRDFDRWRTAVELLRQLREAGIDCKLGQASNAQLTSVKREQA